MINHFRRRGYQVGAMFARCVQPYPWGTVGRNAQGTPKSASRLRRGHADPLRRGVPHPSVPESDWSQACPRTGHPAGATQQPLQPRRNAARPALSDDPRTGTHRDDPAVAAERRVPVPHGFALLSESVHAAAILAARGADDAPPAAHAARSLPLAHDGATTSAVAADFRCGLDRARSLRQAGGGQNRLQPHQAWAAVVSSAALFRGSEQGLLARRTAAGRRPYRERDAGPPVGLLCEGPGRRPLADLSPPTKGFSATPSSSGWRLAARVS
jgi:hypothetical protein